MEKKEGKEGKERKVSKAGQKGRNQRNSLDRHNVTGYNTRQGHHSPSTDPANGSRHDETRHAPSTGTPQGAKGEDDLGKHVRRLATHGVRNAAQEGLKSGGGEEKDSREPGSAVGRVEMRGDDGVRRGHDGAVKARDEETREHVGKDEAEAGVTDVDQEGTFRGRVGDGAAVAIVGR